MDPWLISIHRVLVYCSSFKPQCSCLPPQYQTVVCVLFMDSKSFETGQILNCVIIALPDQDTHRFRDILFKSLICPCSALFSDVISLKQIRPARFPLRFLLWWECWNQAETHHLGAFAQGYSKHVTTVSIVDSGCSLIVFLLLAWVFFVSLSLWSSSTHLQLNKWMTSRGRC